MNKELKEREVTIITGKGKPLMAFKVNRNDPCGCNSGKKSKNCCGDTTRYFVKKLKEPSKENI